MKTFAATLLVLFTLFSYSCSSEKHDSSTTGHEFNGSYSGEYLSRIAFPIGGLGAGMFCMEGTGSISHMSVRNRPEIFNEPTMFAAVAVKGAGAKIAEGPVPGWKRFGVPGSGNGSGGTTYGLPRFSDAEFTARFPFATVKLHDNDLPVEVEITGWSPFIPTDADNSALPMGALEYSLKNSGSEEIEGVFSYNSRNFMQVNNGSNRIRQINGGFVIAETGTTERPEARGEFAIFTSEESTTVDHCWFRGGWFDPLSITWQTIMNGEARATDPVDKDSPGASIFVPFKLNPGETRVIRVMMTWYVPDSNLKLGQDSGEPCEAENAPDCSCSDPWYRPWYTGKFSNVDEAASYWRTRYSDLREKTRLFTDTFYNSSLPPEVIEAVAANLTILKSPTVLRQRDGRLWSWEGCNDNSGCCAGSCTHVWNYAQAIPHLFPALERTLRETEFYPSQNNVGHQTFRSALPIRPVAATFYAAADGQLGGIMKMYRDWRISGNAEWLKKMYPRVVESMEYCIRTWDPRFTGTLEEPHHNTYDIEFWGADGMCTSFYLGALRAITEMGTFLGEDVRRYDELYEKGRETMETDLYDGEYFIQKIKWTGLDSPDPVMTATKAMGTSYSDEALKLLQEEGPKYQYGKGCLSDGVLGAWIAEVCGVGSILDSVKVKSHLNSIYRYNLKNDLSDHPNPQRPSFAFGNDGGLLLCTWPKGEMLSLPFVYSNEVWTGIEYQVASHLMLMGEEEKGLEIVRAARNRYDGRYRNPFNEYECGHWYARAMSSYGMLQGLTGVRYDAVTGSLFMNGDNDFVSFISTETGWGNAGIKNGKPFLDVKYGEITVKRFVMM